MTVTGSHLFDQRLLDSDYFDVDSLSVIDGVALNRIPLFAGLERDSVVVAAAAGFFLLLLVAALV